MYLETEDHSFCDVQTGNNVEIQSGFRQTSYPSHRDPGERGLDPPVFKFFHLLTGSKKHRLPRIMTIPQNKTNSRAMQQNAPVPPYLRVIRSKTYCGCVKPQIIPNAIHV
jgi:hypothetical protein